MRRRIEVWVERDLHPRRPNGRRIYSPVRLTAPPSTQTIEINLTMILTKNIFYSIVFCLAFLHSFIFLWSPDNKTFGTFHEYFGFLVKNFSGRVY